MNLNALASEIRNLDSSLAQRAASAVNASLSIRNWLIGAHIVEFEQNGEERAEYGEKLISALAKRLKADGVKGLGSTNLKLCRIFFEQYPGIRQTLSDQFPKLFEINDLPKIATLSHILEFSPEDALFPIRQSLTDESPSALPLARSSDILTQLSFSHIIELLKIDDPLKRAFYEIEAIKGRWSVRTLKRQIGSLLFERTGLSKDKEKLNWFKEHEMQPDDHPPVGLLLCTDRKASLAKYALGGMDENLFVSEYQVQLPSPEELEKFLIQQQSAAL